MILILNHFFGESITVSGLLTGKDIYEQLKDTELGDEVLIPAQTLRAGEDVFLCGMTAEELAQKLDTVITAIETDGYSFVEALLGVRE